MIPFLATSRKPNSLEEGIAILTALGTFPGRGTHDSKGSNSPTRCRTSRRAAGEFVGPSRCRTVGIQQRQGFLTEPARYPSVHRLCGLGRRPGGRLPLGLHMEAQAPLKCHNWVQSRKAKGRITLPEVKLGYFHRGSSRFPNCNGDQSVPPVGTGSGLCFSHRLSPFHS